MIAHFFGGGEKEEIIFSTVVKSSDGIDVVSGMLTSVDTNASVRGKLAAAMTLDAALSRDELWISCSILSINTLSAGEEEEEEEEEEEDDDDKDDEEELVKNSPLLMRGCNARGAGAEFPLAASLQRLANK